tara:strand:+ start:313 stop:831 length:519 start_codon:yes stop_codon:yes gene_type:complete
MKIIKTKIKDLFIIKGKIFYDQRGFLREAYKKNIIKKNLIFAIVSKSKKNVLRGLHIQRKNPQDKYILVLKGKILDVVVDARKNSKTYGKYYKVILSDKNGKSFFIPKGFLHGFLGLEKENIVLYGCTNYRNKDSEVTVRWNDKNLNIKWPINKPLLSKKDKNGIKFSDLEK